MADMTVKKEKLSRLSGANLSKSFPGALFSPSQSSRSLVKPEPVHDPPPKPLSLLSQTDDDLQPLSWLVSPNLLHNVCAQPTYCRPPPTKRKASLPMTSHFRLAPRCEPKLVRGPSVQHPCKATNRARPNKTAFSKPPYSLASLIFMAIESTPDKRMRVNDVYKWVGSRFPYYEICDQSWKNSVRKVLSLNRCFRKIEKDRRLEFGKGNWWAVDPVLRPQLLRAFKRIGNGALATENITPPTSPLFHTPPTSPMDQETAAAAALCLMKGKTTATTSKKDSANAPTTPTASNTSSSENSPDQPTSRLPKKSIIIDRKSAEGVFALLEMANSRPSSR